MPAARGELVRELQGVRNILFVSRLLFATLFRLTDTHRSPVNRDHDSFPANHADATFVERPFPVEDAPDHFARLRRWELTFGERHRMHMIPLCLNYHPVRFLITWEAVEHTAP